MGVFNHNTNKNQNTESPQTVLSSLVWVNSALVSLHTEGLCSVQRVGHRGSSQHVHSEPVFLHRQGPVRGDLEPGSGRGGCCQPADMAAQHRGEHWNSCRLTGSQLVYVSQNVTGVAVRVESAALRHRDNVCVSSGRGDVIQRQTVWVSDHTNRPQPHWGPLMK